MKKFNLLILFIFISGVVFSQQERQFTQFMYNKLAYNPAATGFKGKTSINAMYRNQWLGFDRAPQSQYLGVDLPIFNDRVGFGLSFNSTSIGIERQTTFEGSYAYRIKLNKGVVAIGLNTSFRSVEKDFSDPILRGSQDIHSDAVIPNEVNTKKFANFGAGLYYENDKFYFGVSVPRAIRNSLSFSADQNEVSSFEVLHFYGMAGATIDLVDNIQLHPQFLLKYTESAPIDADIALIGSINEKIYAGFNYRLGGSKRIGIGESIGLLVGARLQKNVMLSLAYDFTLSEIAKNSNGSIEIGLRYGLKTTVKDPVEEARKKKLKQDKDELNEEESSKKESKVQKKSEKKVKKKKSKSKKSGLFGKKKNKRG